MKSNNNLNEDECNDEANVESDYEFSQKKQQQYNKGAMSKSNYIALFLFVYEWTLFFAMSHPHCHT